MNDVRGKKGENIEKEGKKNRVGGIFSALGNKIIIMEKKEYEYGYFNLGLDWISNLF